MGETVTDPRASVLRRPGRTARAGVAVGAAGTSLLAVSACSGVFSFADEGWPWAPAQAVGQMLTPMGAATALLLGLFLLGMGWWFLRPWAERIQPTVWTVLAIWSGPLLLAPPLLSPDAFIYADLGWIQHLGANPYDVGLGTLGGPYAAQIDPLWRHLGTPYPPLALRTHLLAAWLSGFHPYGGMLAQRGLALVGVCLVAVFLPRLAGAVGASRRWAAWFGVLNPFVLVFFVGGAHNDALMVGLVVFALWLASRHVGGVSVALVLAPAVIGVAMTLKPQAGLAVVAAALIPVAGMLPGLPWSRRLAWAGRRVAAATGVSITVAALVSLSTGLGFGWTRWLGIMGRASSPLSELLALLGLKPILLVATPLLALCGLGWVLVTRIHQPVLVTAVGSLLVAIMGQVVHPWYLVMGLVLLGAVPPPDSVETRLKVSLDAAGRGSAQTRIPSASAPSSV